MNRRSVPPPFERKEVPRDCCCNITVKQETNTKILTVSQILNFICTVCDQSRLKNVMRLYDSNNQNDIIFEMNFFQYNDKARFMAEVCQQGKVQISGVTLNEIQNRQVIRQVQKELTSVVLYEIEDEEILTILRKYGSIKGGMHRHLHKGFSVENGNRSVLYNDPPENIPTILWVGGNRVKCLYKGQDRTPICSFCKIKKYLFEVSD